MLKHSQINVGNLILNWMNTRAIQSLKLTLFVDAQDLRALVAKELARELRNAENVAQTS
jgi:hypothetical protein